MNTYKAALFLLLFSGAATAKPRFYCYSFGNQPADAYGLSADNCTTGKKATCLYAGGCMAVAEDAPAEPPVYTVDQLGVMAANGTLRPSYIHCEASGVVEKGVDASGKPAYAAECPAPTNCQALSYDRMPALGTEAPALSKPVPIAIPPAEVIREKGS